MAQKDVEMKCSKLSRRDFLKLSGTTAMALASSSCGLTPTSTPPSTNTSLPSATATSTLTLTPTITRTPRPTYTPQPPTLRSLASEIGFNIGVLDGGYGFHEYYRQLIKIQVKEFNFGAAFVGMDLTQPEQGKFNFGPADGDLLLAKNNNMKALGYPIIWFAGSPDWLRKGGFSSSELIDIMINHVDTMMSRYKGKVDVWAVVNEAYSRAGDFFYNKIGPKYVELAFQAAREADPSATLIYNDYDNHTANGSLTQHTKDIVNALAAKNLIDGVGLQMHLSGRNAPKKDDVISAMQSYGLPIYVTEFDVNMGGVIGDSEKRYALQAQIYREMLEAAIESGVCKDFVVFGIVDKLSVWERFQWLSGYSPDADPTPFDDDFQPKPAYYALRDVLSQYALGVEATATPGIP